MVKSASTAKTTFKACGIIDDGSHGIDKARGCKTRLPAFYIVPD